MHSQSPSLSATTFAEVPALPAQPFKQAKIIASIRVGKAKVDLYSGADASVVKDLCHVGPEIGTTKHQKSSETKRAADSTYFFTWSLERFNMEVKRFFAKNDWVRNLFQMETRRVC